MAMPPSAPNPRPNRFRLDEILGGELDGRRVAGRVAMKDFVDGSIAQCSLIASSTESLASLPDHIVAVHHMSTKKQMVRSDASWNVTTMADFHPIGDGTEVQFPRHAVSKASLSVNSDNPVTNDILCPAPQPTVTRFLDLRPEPFSEWDDLVFTGALDGAVDSATTTNRRFHSKKGVVALQTSARDGNLFVHGFDLQYRSMTCRAGTVCAVPGSPIIPDFPLSHVRLHCGLVRLEHVPIITNLNDSFKRSA